MIGKLTGMVDSTGEDFVILDVNGVGYVVHCSARTLRSLPLSGEPVALAVETQLREDSLKLYGFRSETERDWFRLLQSVQGVGARLALAIESVLDVERLAAAIAAQDKAELARAPGVGPKLAARIVAELKDKAPAPSTGPLGLASLPQRGREGETAPARAVEDAVTVLVNLGYPRTRAMAAVAASVTALGEGTEPAELIRRGLKELAQ
jgi:Holliday junction DNA helicase RuvA